MRYDWKSEIEYAEGSKQFFEEIDRRFFRSVKPFMPWKKIPFDNLIPFDELKNKNVLEIGVGIRGGNHEVQHTRDYEHRSRSKCGSKGTVTHERS